MWPPRCSVKAVLSPRRMTAGLESNDMLSYAQSLGMVLVAVVLALGMLALLNVHLEDSTRKLANGVNGWQLSILGTVYAVALGFMLSDAWLAFHEAVEDTRTEATAVQTIAHAAQLMPAACSHAMLRSTKAYLDAVINREWPAMERHQTDESAQASLADMWNAVRACQADCPLPVREDIAHALSVLQTRRASRMEDANGHLPLIMWAVLLFGGCSVIASSCLLGNERQWIHCFHVISLTVLITVTLLAIADLDRPFDGATHVDIAPFRSVQEEIRTMAPISGGKNR